MLCCGLWEEMFNLLFTIVSLVMNLKIVDAYLITED